MLTLREALELPCFKQARIVAGANGLGRVVRRVHTVDIPDSKYTWGRGALLLTAGYGLKDSPERQAALVPTLVDNELVGVVFSIGWYYDSVPQAIVEAGDAHDFPVIEVPPGVEFITITERLYVEIVNHEFALKERAADIHNQLTGLVLEGGDLSSVAETLANILGRSVLIESPDYEVVAAAESGPVDENRSRTVAAGRTPDEWVHHLQERGVYTSLQEQMRPIRLGLMPDLGMTMERVVAPIIVGRKIFGYVWIVAGDHPLDDLDELALGHAATVAALVLFKEQAVREAQQALRGDFLAELLRPETELDDRTQERARLLGYQFDRPHQTLFVRSAEANDSSLMRLATRLDSWLRSQGTWGLVVPREHGVVLVVESKSNSVGQTLAESLVAEHEFVSHPLVVGVSRVQHNDRSLRSYYNEAVEASAIGARLNTASAVVGFWELGMLDWLYHLPPEVLAANPYLAQIEKLAEHDANHRGDLFHTLEAYLEYGGALAEAAAALNVHRNTLLYRLGRIEDVAGVNLKDVAQRLNLFVALKAYRLSPPLT